MMSLQVPNRYGWNRRFTLKQMRRHVIFREIALGKGDRVGSLSNEVLERHLSGKVENTNQRLNLHCHCNQTVDVSLPAHLRKWTLQCHFSERQAGWKRVRTCVAHQTEERYNSGLCHCEAWLFFVFFVPHSVKKNRTQKHIQTEEQ